MAVQQSFALMTAGSGVYLIDMDTLKRKQKYSASGALVLLRRSDGDLLIRRFLARAVPGVDTRPIVQRFFCSPDTIMYDGVDFQPGQGNAGALNLWVGPTLLPADGTWNTLRDFLETVVCSGDAKVFAYLIRYLAHALQKPQEKPGVMITLIGGQGIGKGTLLALIQKIWSATTLLTSRISDVVGDFNESLEGCMWVLLDESHSAGDRRIADALKSIVTSPEIRVNPKGQPSRTIPSVHRVVIATNRSHAAFRDHDDRRDLTLRASDRRKGDHAYWQRVYGAIESESAAMMHDLLQLDLSAFNVRLKPDTGELLEQKILSLPTIEAFWYDCLHSGAIPLNVEWPGFVSTVALIGDIREFGKGARDPSLLTSNAVAAALRRVCPGAKDAQRAEGVFRRRGYDLPALSECRTAFEAHLGGQIEW